MCYSAEVSFGAAIILTGIGVATAMQVRERSQYWLAALPLLFALQQASEGILWIGLTNNWTGCGIECVARYAFLILAFCTWPWLFPFALSQVEHNRQRKRVLYGFVLAGLGLSVFNFFYLFNQGMGARIVEHSIQYTNTLPKEGPLYLILVSMPWAISSSRYGYLCAFVGAISFIITFFFYWHTFTSVWCFFAAIISAIIYYIVKDLNESKEPSLKV